jgi:demethylmenaquinone methyltransferase/2-methoxy-6-polyprenyl-1,4-benzoquinol methylase
MRNDNDADTELLAEQQRYYEARAPIYDQLYLRQGRYAVDDVAWTANWHQETGELERFAQALPADGSVLELAPGTGLWTRFLAPRARHLVAVDASPAMLARNRALGDGDRIRSVEADLFAWDQDERFDLIFTGFFLSHIPPARWGAFWGKVAGWLAPDGVLAFVDDCWGPDRPRSSDRVEGGPDHAHIRRLGDDAYTIVKRFFRPEELQAAFADVGLEAEVSSTGEHFLYGTARV